MANANYPLSEQDTFSVVLAIHHLAYFAEQLSYSESEQKSFQSSLAFEAIQSLSQILLPVSIFDDEEESETGDSA